MKSMTHELRLKIKQYIKNGLDISELIKDVNIQNEDLSDSIISSFNRICDNISGVSLSKSTIGAVGTVTNLSGTKMVNCRFDDSIWKGFVLMRRCDCRQSDFSGAQLINVEYQYSNFEGAKFCETCLRLGTKYSAHSKFSPDLFSDLGKMWGLEIKQK